MKFIMGCSFHCIVYDYSCADWNGIHDHLRDVTQENIFKISASAATIEFCEKLRVGLIYRQASNRCKRVLEAVKLAYANNESPLLPRNLALVTCGELLIVFSTKVNLLYLLDSTTRRCCLLHLRKQNCLLKIFQ